MLAIYTNDIEYMNLNTDFFFLKRDLLSLHIIWGKKERKRTKYQCQFCSKINLYKRGEKISHI